MKKVKIMLSKLQITGSLLCNLADNIEGLPSQLMMSYAQNNVQTLPSSILSGFANKITGELFALDQELVFMSDDPADSIFIAKLECIHKMGTFTFENLWLKKLGNPSMQAMLVEALK